jgi:glycosyltransferase involved in cell wall biosynthesis
LAKPFPDAPRGAPPAAAKTQVKSHKRAFALVSNDHLLLDVSRLIWRVWRGRLPTGIDRVCLEYLRHFRSRSLAVVQFRGRTLVLSASDSDRLSELLLDGGAAARRRLLALAPKALLRARRGPPAERMLYLNVGHTGLHDPALPVWIRANRVKAVHMIHDLIPVTHPQFCRPGEAQKHAKRLENALASATGLIVNSQATLDELATFAAARGLAMPRALVAWLGGYPMGVATPAPKLGRPYFVTVGTIEGRKNHLLLLRVWSRLVEEMGESAPVLLIIGQRGWQATEAETILDSSGELQSHVRELAACSDEELAGWIADARALLMPSFAEGFGLPVVEALQLGTPVIATDLPVYREVVGDIPTFLDADNVDRWARAVIEFTGDGPERHRQKEALKGYRAPDWRSHLAAVEKWLEEL